MISHNEDEQKDVRNGAGADVPPVGMDPRTPLDVAFLRRALVEHGPYSQLEHTFETGSTNTDLVAAGHKGAPAWTVYLTEHQVSGRGRMGRKFEAPPSSQLTLSVLIRPPAESVARLGTMSLATGLALVDAIGSETGVGMKWPNDLVYDGRKLCGILAEAVDLGDNPAVVIGLGLNTSLRTDELPVAHASSLELEGIAYERNELAVRVLTCLYHRLFQWERNDAHLMDDYRAVCVTLGQDVRAILPGDKELLGRATAVNEEGHLIITDEAGTDHEMAVGDIIHLRQKDQWKY